VLRKESTPMPSSISSAHRRSICWTRSCKQEWTTFFILHRPWRDKALAELEDICVHFLPDSTYRFMNFFSYSP
jgi:hypothetical protein